MARQTHCSKASPKRSSPSSSSSSSTFGTLSRSSKLSSVSEKAKGDEGGREVLESRRVWRACVTGDDRGDVDLWRFGRRVAYSQHIRKHAEGRVWGTYHGVGAGERRV